MVKLKEKITKTPIFSKPTSIQKDVVLSIRPQYSDKILKGLKTVELRRRFPLLSPNSTIAYIYSTSPVQAMVGVTRIQCVQRLPVKQIWTKFESTIFVEHDDFKKYFCGIDFGFVIVFDSVKSFSQPIPLNKLRKAFGFNPPQSFMYVKHDLGKALNNRPTSITITVDTH